jgi:hypothetical protein
LVFLQLDLGQQVHGVRQVHRLYLADRSHATLDGIFCVIDALDFCGAFDTRNFACQLLCLLCSGDVAEQEVLLLLHWCFRFLFFSFRPSSNLHRFFDGSPFQADVWTPLGFEFTEAEKPVSCFASCLEKAAQTNWQLVFDLEVFTNGDGFLRKPLFDSVFALLRARQPKLPEEFSLYHVLTYFRLRSSLGEAERLNWLKRFDSDFFRIDAAMSTSYKDRNRIVLQRIRAAMLQSVERGDVVLSNTVVRPVDLVEKHTKSVRDDELHMQLEWNEYVSQYLTLESLWSPKRQPMFASFAVSDLLTSPFLKYRHGPMPRLIERVASPPLFQSAATRLKIGASVKMTVILEKDRLILDRSDRLRVIKLKEVKSVTKKMHKSIPSLVELLTLDGRLFLLEFPVRLVDKFVSALSALGVDPVKTDTELQHLLTDWKSGKITAFAYLTRLNDLKGRSLCNEDFYPIFPHPLVDGVLRDFHMHPALDTATSTWTELFAPFRPYVLRELPPDAFAPAFLSRTELSAEFFTFFECFAGLPVPAPFADAFELVYFLRGLLECDAIADSLHVWVSQAFHCGFTRPPRAPSSSDARSVNLPEFRAGAYSNSCFRLLCGDDVLSVSIEEEVRRWPLQFPAGAIYAHESTLAFVDRRRMVFSVNNGDAFREAVLDFCVDRIVHCGDLLGLWTRDLVVVMRVPHVVARFCIKTDFVVCMYASAAYNTVVVGTRGGRLVFYGLHGGRFVNAVELGGAVPLKVIVTPAFGFVVVASHGKIAVFTVNGTLIRERDFVHSVDEWCTFANGRGFDFVLLSTAEGKVLVLEAFTLRESPTLFQTQPAVAALAYDGGRRGFVVATPDGCGHIVPCDPSETILSLD